MIQYLAVGGVANCIRLDNEPTLNMSMLYAHGVWRPTWGVQIIADAQTPS